MRYPYGETVTVLLEQRDRLGDVVLVEVGELPGCALAPRSGTAAGVSPEDGPAGRALVQTGLVLYGPPAGDGVIALTAQHRVRLGDGSLWRVEGEPAQWRSPLTGWEPGVEVTLRRVTG